MGPVQQACEQLKQQGHAVHVLIDETYKPLVEGTLAADQVVYYPRKKIEQRNRLAGMLTYLKLLLTLRRYKADVVVDTEADSVSAALVLLSGAKRKLGPEIQKDKHASRYHEHAPRRIHLHEYYKYHDVMKLVADIGDYRPCYGKVAENAVAGKSVDTILANNFKDKGIDSGKPLVAIHAGATKGKKLWPRENFVAVIKQLQQRGCVVVLIGAGETDRTINEAINQQLSTPAINLCNQLNLVELASFFRRCAFYIGNDSGPMHLASAQAVPGIAIYGPSNSGMWGPLSDKTKIMTGEQGCELSCNNGESCQFDFRCLHTLSVEIVANHALQMLDL